MLRGTFGTCTQFALVLGILAADVLAFPFSRPGVWGWRTLFAITAILATFQLFCAPYLFESPRWLLTRDPEVRGGARRCEEGRGGARRREETRGRARRCEEVRGTDVTDGIDGADGADGADGSMAALVA